MKTSRLEAFSDGVLAIILTIMVLELKVPIDGDFESLKLLAPKLLNYILSFVFVGIYWNNHHHIFMVIDKINGTMLWLNLLFLFWLSLLPVATGWVSEHFESNWPVAFYGLILLASSISFALMEKVALKIENQSDNARKSLRDRKKEIRTIVIYASAIIIAFWLPLISLGLYVVVALMWIIPDKRVEDVL